MGGSGSAKTASVELLRIGHYRDPICQWPNHGDQEKYERSLKS